jgi:benzoyl-CoA reductase/2-hydroxyglutaryl-CoA dehydratase subunit BcrC/BadD/HgdB
MQTLKLLKTLNDQYYEDARNAADMGKKVGFVNVFAPTELFYAMDIVPIYPENHAVFIQARKLTTEMSEKPQAMGYMPGICSYALCDLGSAITGKSPVGGLPKPDFFLTTNAQCGTLTKWFERMSELYAVPLYLIDVPYTGGKYPDYHSRAYVEAQLYELANFLETISGNRLKRDRLVEVIAVANETTTLWADILSAASAVPSPISVFDQFFSMAPIVAQRGSNVALEFYRALKKEVFERVQKGVGAVPHEKYRLYWDSLPLWHELKWLSELLLSFEACLVSTVYTLPWAEFRLDPENPFQSWTDEYVHYFDWNLIRRVELILGLQKRYHLDGFIFHNDRSCKMFSMAIPQLKRIVQERSGRPGFILEGDHGDPRFLSKDQVEKGLANYFDILESGRKQRGKGCEA